ncbi:putative ABC transport system ATP-binding protein [Actinoplanes octamycinicus]|uniref:Putative ABC transport system ATP-binding protein n=1 Tax=Actinoplanes octamycinicus TaxID=135948 RepID=A0A7W7H3S7_9ACTN|nr:ABC transporter ATP-binding protein [Actinoplanes octamycinicus]MBB4743408.1 putative ABC transport system ATP-binding protein [Actinoplanes octamycinicus]GIE61926.1 multidrug ABC transporter ATP-binding protein [Actinoplanes octamycinicus]
MSTELLTDLSGSRPRRLIAVAVRESPQLRQGLLATGLLALLAGAGRIIAPLTVQHVIDAGLAPGTVGPAVAVGVGAVLLAGISSLLLNRRLQGKVEAALAGLRRDGLRRVHDMAAATADRVPSADLVSRLTGDLDQVTTFLQGGGIQFLTNAAQLLIATGILLVYGWQLAVPVLLITAVLIAAMTRTQRIIARRFDRARRDLSAMQSAVAESVTGGPLIRSTGTQERTRRKLDRAVDRARDSLIGTLVPLHGNASLGELAISTMTVTVLLGGVWWGGFTAGQVVAMVFLVTFFVRPLQFVVQSLGEAQNALTGWRRALELVSTPPERASGGVALPPGPISVDLADVSARYPGGPLVLHDVSVRITAGEHVAVVGRTGSGKSTFAKLLTRRVTAASGTIRLSGVLLDSVGDLAGRVVIVPQDPFLFDGTIKDNILVGTPEASEADAQRIVDRLGLRDWLATLPAGLDTPVGVRGQRLSIGERQLVALARTALADPDLVIFDESTSGVDQQTDAAVQRALTELTRGRTTISIAHRIPTAEAADRILVFADGRLAQTGPHDLLRSEPGPYAGLVAAWHTTTPSTPEPVGPRTVDA